MNDLAARKRLLVAQADLHRQFIALECARGRQLLDQAQDATRRNRWWLVAGAVAVGVLLAPRKRGLAGLLPLIPGLLRLFRQ